MIEFNAGRRVSIVVHEVPHFPPLKPRAQQDRDEWMRTHRKRKMKAKKSGKPNKKEEGPILKTGPCLSEV